ncbi:MULTISPECIES: helix-turn-helix transcriptional regulator [Paenibacillus]|uniref:helix-turn-helix transcriptional regulator n=1 Tax=Paenibacillus TaxID=44249 RepID=UPI002FE40210
MSEISYTAEEVAKLLKVSKLTVYDLIKKGSLPAYRVGKQMRIDADDLEQYKRIAKGGALHPAPQSETLLSGGSLPPQPAAAEKRRQSTDVSRVPGTLVITGQDLSLDLLAKHLERANPELRPLRSHDGSLDGLISMYQGNSDIVSTHLLDGDTGEYNLPYINKILTGHSYLVINLLLRQAGLYVRRGNPKQLKTWSDLGRKGIRLINREIGSGARVLLDEQLRLHGISRTGIDGYGEVETSHLAVAGKVAAGQADVGVGIENAVSLIAEVDFIPLIQERYDLVVLKKKETAPWIDRFLETVKSPEFRQELASIQGYDLSLSGQVLYDSEV